MTISCISNRYKRLEVLSAFTNAVSTLPFACTSILEFLNHFSVLY